VRRTIRSLYAALLASMIACSHASAAGVDGWVTKDGALLIEGHRFSDPDTLKAKLTELAHRKPAAPLNLLAQRDVPTAAEVAATSLLRRAGWKGLIGILTPPRN